MDFALTYKQAFEFLKLTHLIPDARQVALRGRIQHLQKLKFPNGINTGKGRAARYGAEQMIWLAVAFELLEIGLTPERAVNVIQKNSSMVREATSAAVKALLSARKRTVFLMLDPEALFVPDSAHTSGDAAVVTFKYFHSADLGDIFQGARPGQFKRIALIDHARIVALLCEWSSEAGVATLDQAIAQFRDWSERKRMNASNPKA